MMFSYATNLYLFGLLNAFELSPRSIVWFYMNKMKSESDLFKMHATASRLAQAEQKDFEKFINIISND